MKLKVNDDTVNYLTISGKDIVKAQMPLECAEKIISEGKQTKSKKFDGYGLCVNNKFYFETVNDKSEE